MDIRYAAFTAVLSEMSGDTGTAHRYLSALARADGVSAAAKEWALLEDARLMALSDTGAAVAVLEQLRKARSPSNVATAEEWAARLAPPSDGPPMISVVERICGKAPTSVHDFSPYFRCAAASSDAGAGHLAAVAVEAQERALSDADPLAPIRIGVEGLNSGRLGLARHRVVQLAAARLRSPGIPADIRARAAAMLIDALQTDPECLLPLLRKLESVGLAPEATRARERLFSEGRLRGEPLGVALVDQLRTALGAGDGHLAERTARILADVADCGVVRAARRSMAAHSAPNGAFRNVDAMLAQRASACEDLKTKR